MYVCGPTVYGRIHVGNARPFVVFSLLKRFLVHRGVRDDICNKYHGHQRQDLRGRATSREVRSAGAGRGDDGALRRRYRRAGARTARPRAAGQRDIGGDHRADRAVDRGGACVRGLGDVYFQVRSYPRIWRDLPSERGCTWTRARASRAQSASGIRSISPCGRRRSRGGHVRGRPPGVRGRPGWHIECSAMAEAAAGPRFRDPRRRLGPAVPPPRERGRPDVRGPGTAAGPAVGPQRDGPPRRGQDGQVGGEHLPAPRGA